MCERISIFVRSSFLPLFDWCVGEGFGAAQTKNTNATNNGTVTPTNANANLDANATNTADEQQQPQQQQPRPHAKEAATLVQCFQQFGKDVKGGNVLRVQFARPPSMSASDRSNSKHRLLRTSNGGTAGGSIGGLGSGALRLHSSHGSRTNLQQLRSRTSSHAGGSSGGSGSAGSQQGSISNASSQTLDMYCAHSEDIIAAVFVNQDYDRPGGVVAATIRDTFLSTYSSELQQHWHEFESVAEEANRSGQEDEGAAANESFLPLFTGFRDVIERLGVLRCEKDTVAVPQLAHAHTKRHSNSMAGNTSSTTTATAAPSPMSQSNNHSSSFSTQARTNTGAGGGTGTNDPWATTKGDANTLSLSTVDESIPTFAPGSLPSTSRNGGVSILNSSSTASISGHAYGGLGGGIGGTGGSEKSQHHAGARHRHHLLAHGHAGLGLGMGVGGLVGAMIPPSSSMHHHLVEADNANTHAGDRDDTVGDGEPDPDHPSHLDPFERIPTEEYMPSWMVDGDEDGAGAYGYGYGGMDSYEMQSLGYYGGVAETSTAASAAALSQPFAVDIDHDATTAAPSSNASSTDTTSTTTTTTAAVDDPAARASATTTTDDHDHSSEISPPSQAQKAAKAAKAAAAPLHADDVELQVS